MKKFTFRLAFIILVLLVPTSCYYEYLPNKTSIEINLNDLHKSGSIHKAPGETYNTARIYIYINNSIYPTPEGERFFEKNTDETKTLTISDLPANIPIRAVIALGIDSENFQPVYYAESDEFIITAGIKNELPFNVKETPLTYSTQLMGKSLPGLLFLNNSLYVAEEKGSLYSGDGLASLSETGAELPEGQKVNSISVGKFYTGSGFAAEPWVNTTEGIYPIRNGSYDTTFSSALSSVSVLESGAFHLGDYGIDSTLSIFFQTNGGLGGTYVLEADYQNPADWEWLDDIDLSDYLTGRPILDFIVSETNAYFATKLGSFRLSSNIIDGTLEVESIDEILDIAQFFDVTNEQGEKLQITAMEISDSKMYLGTENGVWQGDISETEEVILNKTLMEDTAGKYINDIKLSSDAAQCIFTAANTVYILDTTTNELSLLPEAILPGIVLETTISSSGRLFISGTGGLAAMDL